MAHFSEEQFAILSQYERWMHPVVYARWCPALGDRQVLELQAIRDAIIPNLPRVNTSCSHCIYSLVNDLGVRYYEDKEAREKKVEMSAAPAKKVRKAAVKTSKK